MYLIYIYIYILCNYKFKAFIYLFSLLFAPSNPFFLLYSMLLLQNRVRKIWPAYFFLIKRVGPTIFEGWKWSLEFLKPSASKYIRLFRICTTHDPSPNQFFFFFFFSLLLFYVQFIIPFLFFVYSSYPNFIIFIIIYNKRVVKIWKYLPRKTDWPMF